MTDYYQRSLALHEQARGKIQTALKVSVETLEDLAIVYTPGVARPCEAIAEEGERARYLTMRGNSVAIVTDGSAVLGLGNIGPLAALPVMEGKALLFKKFADIDAWPICLDTQDTEEIIRVIQAIAPSFGGVNLEDIAAPRCFEIERRLQNLGIPVFHDDQHGTAIVVLAALLNACRYLGRDMRDLKVVVNGAGAAGTAIARLLMGRDSDGQGLRVADVIVCDSKGAICSARTDLSASKRDLLLYTNQASRCGSVKELLVGADVFVGVSKGNLLSRDDVAAMAPRPMIFALANPYPEILPAEAYAGGAGIVATGRSDFPNQVNNALVFPGIFRGALQAHAKRITTEMKLAAAIALSSLVERPEREKILPCVLDESVVPAVAKAVCDAALSNLTLVG